MLPKFRNQQILFVISEIGFQLQTLLNPGLKDMKFHRYRKMFKNKISIRRRFYRVTENDASGKGRASVRARARAHTHTHTQSVPWCNIGLCKFFPLKSGVSKYYVLLRKTSFSDVRSLLRAIHHSYAKTWQSTLIFFAQTSVPQNRYLWHWLVLHQGTDLYIYIHIYIYINI